MGKWVVQIFVSTSDNITGTCPAQNSICINHQITLLGGWCHLDTQPRQNVHFANNNYILPFTDFFYFLIHNGNAFHEFGLHSHYIF